MLSTIYHAVIPSLGKGDQRSSIAAAGGVIGAIARSDDRLTELLVHAPKRPCMEHVATRVPEDIHAEIREIQDVNDCSQSEAVRDLLRRGMEYDRLQRERNSLQNQLNTLAGREREHAELVEYVEQEKSLKERERARRDAPLWRRAQWFVFGRQ